MGRVVFAEDNLLDYLTALTKTNSTAIGLIIGQSTKSKDYVIHMARTGKADDAGLVEPLTFSTLKGLKAELIDLIAGHIVLVNGRLPGGLSVLGTFICFPGEIFSDASLKPTLKKLLPNSVKGQIKETFPLSPTETGALLFHFNPATQKYSCKSLEGSSISSTFTEVDWNFGNNCTKWCQISSRFGLNFPTIVGKKSIELKAELKKLLSNVNESLSNAVVVVGNKVMKQDQSFATLIKSAPSQKVADSNDIQLLEASIFTPSTQNDVISYNVEVTKCESKISVEGVIRSQAFVSQKGTMEDAIAAVKQDISRSLATRIKLHLESLVEEPEEYEYGETIHEPPRRVTVSLPNSPFSFTDYIFSGEDCSEVIRLFKLLLDVEVTEKDINQEYEIHADHSSFNGFPLSKVASSQSDDLLNSSLSTRFLIAAFSFAMILIAIAIAIEMRKEVSPDEGNLPSVKPNGENYGSS